MTSLVSDDGILIFVSRELLQLKIVKAVRVIKIVVRITGQSYFLLRRLKLAVLPKQDAQQLLFVTNLTKSCTCQTLELKTSRRDAKRSQAG